MLFHNKQFKISMNVKLCIIHINQVLFQQFTINQRKNLHAENNLKFRKSNFEYLNKTDYKF